MSVSARVPLLTGLVVLAACPAPAPTLPAGEIVNAIAVDDEHALVLVQDPDESGVSALVRADGKLVWAVDVGKDIIPFFALHRRDLGDRLLLIGGETSRLVRRADGLELARRVNIPPAARAQAGEPQMDSSTELVDGTLISLVRGHIAVITAFDPLADRELWRLDRPYRTHLEPVRVPGYLALDVHGDRLRATPGEAPREPGLGLVGSRESQLQILDARSGTLLASHLQVGHCEAAGSIYAITREDRLIAFELGGALSAPRTVLAQLSLPAPTERGWQLHSCARNASTLVLNLVDSQEMVLTVAVDLASGQQREQHGMCDLGAPRPVHERWIAMRLGHHEHGVALLDVLTGAVAWVQDRAIHAAIYSRSFVVDDAVYLSSQFGPGERQLQHLLALDPTTGDITGAAAIVDAHPVDAESFAGGQVWVFAARMNRSPTAPLVRLDARTLRPLHGSPGPSPLHGPPGPSLGAALPPGLDIIDTAVEARAAQRPVHEREPGLLWDPLQPSPSPSLRCSATEP